MEDKLSDDEIYILSIIRKCIERNPYKSTTYVTEVMLESDRTYLEVAELVEKLEEKGFIIEEIPGGDISLL